MSLAAAGQGDLPSRVRALLDPSQRRGPAGAAWIVFAGTIALGIVIGGSPLRVVMAAAQRSADAPAQTFEVASVKPCKEEPNTGGQRRPEWRMPSPERLVIECIPLDRIIYFAYASIGNMEHPLLNNHPADPDHIRGGPGWLRTEKYTIDAKAAGPTDRAVMMGPMLRALLEERFKLKTRRERETATLYALTVAKGGLKIKPIADDGCTDFNATTDMSRDEVMRLNTGPKPVCGAYTALGDGVNRHWILGGTTLERFATQQLSSVLEHYVLDQTGVRDRFNINLTFGVDENIRRGVFGGAPFEPVSADIERGPSIFTALEDQLGLKLAAIKGPREFLVVDRVERPGPD